MLYYIYHLQAPAYTPNVITDKVFNATDSIIFNYYDIRAMCVTQRFMLYDEQ